jgi:hypothetical protein
MKRLLVSIAALAAVSVCLAQAGDFRDYVVTRQKVYAQSSNWGWDPVWGQNYGNGKAQLRETIRNFFSKMTVQVKAGQNNNGSLLFLTHQQPINSHDFWHLSGFKWRKANQYDAADEVVDNNKRYLVERINEWMEPFGFSVELAENSDIGRMRYRRLIQYCDYGIWVIIKPDQVAAFKKAKDSGFTKIVKVVDNRGNLSYHPYGDLMREYNKKHKGQGNQSSRSNAGTPFDDAPVNIK